MRLTSSISLAKLRHVQERQVFKNRSPAAIEHIAAKAPKQLRLDRAGFFIVLLQPQKGLIVCEHYENNGRLAHVIEGRQAALIASTVVERGFVTQLDHAAYLGRELEGPGGAFKWQHVRAGRRPWPALSGGAAQNEEVRLPMQLDRDLDPVIKRPSKPKQGNEYDHKKQMARRPFGRSNNCSRRGRYGAGSAAATANAGGRCDR